MLLSTKKEIRRVLINSADNVDVVLPVRGLNNVLAIDYDIKSQLVFWIDGHTNQIMCAQQNGTGVQTLRISKNASPFDLAIDP